MVGETGLNPQAEAEFNAQAEEIRKKFDQQRVDAIATGIELDENLLQDEENKALAELQAKIEDWQEVDQTLSDISEKTM